MAKLSETEFQGIVSGLIRDAEDFIDSEISPIRANATVYYQGRVPDLEDVEGRSKMTTRDVRDTVKAMLPSIMRVFTSTERVVEFTPVGPEDEQFADQATDYANYVLMKDNDGFMVLHSTFKDALVRRCGIVKAWWDEKEKTVTQRYTGLDEDAFSLLQMEPDAVIEDVMVAYEVRTVADAMGMPVEIQVPFYDCKVTKKMTEGRIKVCPVPPEELIIARNDREIGETFVSHRRLMTVSDLVRMGYNKDLVESKAGAEDFFDNEEVLVRSPYRQVDDVNDPFNPVMRRVLYHESYAFIDRNGDGIAEYLKICTIGSDNEVVDVEEIDFHPFVCFSSDPEPHLSPLEGFSTSEDLMDIQRLKSAVWRNSLDGLAQALNTRMGVVEGRVNIEDVLNNEVGAIIRMKSPDAVVPFATPDVSASGLQMLGYADEVKEARTGLSKAAVGLDPDALRSTAKNAANAIVSATQSQLEMVTRVLANGMRDLFKLLLKLMVTHQDQPRTIRLRGEWVPIDPRQWNVGMDVSINVALGSGTNEEKFNVLAGFAAKQELILQTLGANNPLVNLAQYSNTLSKMCELAGFQNASQFVTQLPSDFQLPEPPPQADPQTQAAELLAQVEREKAQAKLQIDAAKLEAETQLKAAKLQLDREQMEADFARKQLELEMQAAKLQAEMQMKEAEAVLKQLTAIRGMQNEDAAKANEEAQQEANEARQEGMLTQAVVALGQMIAASQQQTAKALSAPKMVIRDASGRVAGVQTMEEPEEQEKPEESEGPESGDKEED